MNILGTNKFDQDSIRHYNHVVDSLNQPLDAGKTRTRIRVGRVDDKVFVEPDKKRKKLLKRSPQFSLDFFKLKKWSKITWFLSLILVIGLFRLVFMNQGIINYFEKNESLAERLNLIEQLKTENIQLAKEIKRGNEDVRYQKNLAREQLGVISSEEYLILFAPKKLTPSN